MGRTEDHHKATGVAGSRPRGVRAAPWVVCALSLLLALATGAQEEPISVGGPSEGDAPPEFTLRFTPKLQETLSRLQDQFLVWNSALLRGDLEQADRALDDLEATSDRLGFERIPELAAAAAQRALEAARSGQEDRARAALEAARRLGGGTSTYYFARAHVAAALDGPLAVVGADLRGLWRSFFERDVRVPFGLSLFGWCVGVLFVTSLLFVALLTAVRGGEVLADLAFLMRRPFGPWWSVLAAVLLLLAPFFLPGSWILALLVWCVLLWGYCSRSQRFLLALALACVVALPVTFDWAVARAASRLEGHQRFLDEVATGSLGGNFFERLLALGGEMPDSPAVLQLTADLNQRMEQDDVARPFYARVAQMERFNGRALNNLGLFHLVRGELVPAIEFFQQAAEDDEIAAAAYYNLARAYDQLLEFGQAGDARSSGRSRSPEEFGDWSNSNLEFVATYGGIERLSEIRAELKEREPEQQSLAPLARAWGAWLLLVALGPLVYWLRSGSLGMRRSVRAESDLAFERWIRKLIPGLLSAEAGDGPGGFLAVLIPVALGMIVARSQLVLPAVPWMVEPRLVWLTWPVLVLLAAFLLVRWRSLT